VSRLNLSDFVVGVLAAKGIAEIEVLTSKNAKIEAEAYKRRIKRQPLCRQAWCGAN
jgi:hypothetical protein